MIRRLRRPGFTGREAGSSQGGDDGAVLSSPSRRKWLNSGRVAEISHFGACNFLSQSESKYIGASDRNKI